MFGNYAQISYETYEIPDRERGRRSRRAGTEEARPCASLAGSREQQNVKFKKRTSETKAVGEILQYPGV